MTSDGSKFVRTSVRRPRHLAPFALDQFLVKRYRRSGETICGLAVGFVAALLHQGTARAQFTSCETHARDGNWYVSSTPITSPIVYESLEAVHAYDPSCPSYVFDFYVASYSNQCDPPASYSCGVNIAAAAFDLPSAFHENYLGQVPDNEIDCEDWTFKGELWRQGARSSSIVFEEEWGGYGSWQVGTCNVIYHAWTTNVPPFYRANTLGVGWDRYRVIISTILRGTPQQVQASILPTPLP